LRCVQVPFSTGGPNSNIVQENKLVLSALFTSALFSWRTKLKHGLLPFPFTTVYTCLQPLLLSRVARRPSFQLNSVQTQTLSKNDKLVLFALCTGACSRSSCRGWKKAFFSAELSPNSNVVQENKLGSFCAVCRCLQPLPLLRVASRLPPQLDQTQMLPRH